MTKHCVSTDRDDMGDSPLGKASVYISAYDPSLLYSIPRKRKRSEILQSNEHTHSMAKGILPFYGFDTWNAYELSWLNPKGKPCVALAQFDIACTSENIVESKSFKLYLNSFNNTTFEAISQVEQCLKQDISRAVDGEVFIKLMEVDAFPAQSIVNFQGECIDTCDIVCDTYTISPNFLLCDSAERVEEILYSHLLKSNCLVTGQPDWGSVRIMYQGPKLDRAGLLKYLISFRNHNEFHEQCVERIFMDILTICKPSKLTVEARYTRRGGLDINPIRSTEHIEPSPNIRLARQ